MWDESKKTVKLKHARQVQQEYVPRFLLSAAGPFLFRASGPHPASSPLDTRLYHIALFAQVSHTLFYMQYTILRSLRQAEPLDLFTFFAIEDNFMTTLNILTSTHTANMR